MPSDPSSSSDHHHHGRHRKGRARGDDKEETHPLNENEEGAPQPPPKKKGPSKEKQADQARAIILRRELAAINLLRFTTAQWFFTLGFVIGYYSVGIWYKHYSLLIWAVGCLTLAIGCHAAWEYSFRSLAFSMVYHSLLSVAGLVGVLVHGYWALWFWHTRKERDDHHPVSQTVEYSFPLSLFAEISWIGSVYYSWYLRKLLRNTDNLRDSLAQELEEFGNFDPMTL
mmetsp:Transcript_6000/g.13236  ORF Transcript_6000/g.13236 Transcript_6000/m.13236 type:complete len:227 (-) Transcript_6000:97-777(-)